ncbi:tandem-95 repeat protein [Frigoribacterium faeni]|uniref:Ig-like domain-containing protein n=1 Tax=Frigoribacterium faeni TaxID=145483 RepID=UPI001FAD2F20|nr:Ig-like domain-containing protein [Frigoribacterium faeni]MCJ0701248.1 tandem-95 repeat protein [Frigoribacterium faeni]
MSRLGAWMRSHRSAVATGVSGLVIVGLVAGVALVGPGYEQQRLDLDDGTVWVANGSRTAIGRANPDVGELNSAVRSQGSDLSVVQTPTAVVLVDRTSATAGIVDPATATADVSVPLPPESPEVLLVGDRAVVLSGGTGEVWSAPAAELDSFTSDAAADLSLGGDLVAGTSPEGGIVVFSAESGMVSLVDSGQGLDVTSTQAVETTGEGPYQVAAAGSHWALLDTVSGELTVDGRTVEVPGGGDGVSALQTGGAADDAFVVATSSGLSSVPFAADRVDELVSGRDGTPARPVVVDGCLRAAWSDGTEWSDCSSSRGGLTALEGVPADAGLVYDVNGRRVVLNDPVTGRSWAVQSGGRLIDNWDDLLDRDEMRQDDEDDVGDDTLELDPDQKAPVAADDDFGARAGRATSLPVLLDDYDPNGDPLSIDTVEGVDDAAGRVDIVDDRQHLLLTLDDAASGVLVFDYTISDGRGGRDTATVTVTVRSPDENGPPEQRRSSEAVVASSGRVTTPVLGDWVDPDGDAFYLTSASGEGGVSSAPDGDVVYQDSGAGATTTDVALTVSDGRAEANGVLRITVAAAGDTPLTTDSFSVQAYAGRQTTIRPLAYAEGGTGPVSLNSVPAQEGAEIAPSYDAGTLLFTSDEVRTHNLEYTVTDGDQTASGTIRVEVLSPPDVNSAPVTTPKTVFVETLSSETVDAAGTDRDPAGNVLLVTSVSQAPESTGLRVETIDQRYVRVTLTRPLDDGPVELSYTVTNGLASAVGSITVVEIPRRSQTQPPVATDDQATVRAGDVIDIDVLANDEQPNGDEVSLGHDLRRPVPEGGGLLFASGDRLRYLAPETPGIVTAVYTAVGEDGQTADAQVTITVRESDAATNAPPVPETVTARVVAGETVRITVPLDGIDADGDSVQLVGIGSNPDKGAVSMSGPDRLDYEAGPYAAGTDTFEYSVVDGLGARATGVVRVGVSARADGSRAPVAVEDDVTMRPGGSITVRVLDNDSDPDGGDLSVTGVESSDETVDAVVVDDELVTVTPPSTPGSYGVVYEVENARGGSSSSFVTVTVDPDAPPNPPLADDTVLDLRDIRGRVSVDVDVLANVFSADVPTSQLGLGVETGYDGTAEVTDARRLRITVTDASQIVPFWVSHPAVPDVRSLAFVRVPGFDDALPQLDRSAPSLSVVSESTLRIDLEDHVIAAGDRGVRLTDAGSVRATHANGDDLVVDDTTLSFTSADLFFGVASVSFEVTDGRSADDPEGRTATLVLPITVTPRDNQPPVFTGTSLDLEPGESRSIDLSRVTTYPYPDDVGELRYELGRASGPGFSFDLTGRELTVTAAASTVEGTTRTLPVSVSDSAAVGRGGAVRLSVVGSTRPLVAPAADSVVVARGGAATVDVLANDESRNPFPGQPLRVGGIRGLAGASLPAGVAVTPSDDGRTLAVRVAATASPIDANIQYQVVDATGDPSRAVWGNVTVSVQDVPDTPVAPVRVGDSSGGRLTLSYAAPASNNSPLTGFRLTGVGSAGSVYTRDCGVSTVCTLTDLDPEQTFRFSVVAANAVGASEPSASSDPYRADFVPAAPGDVQVSPSTTAPGVLDVRWAAVPRPAGGTAVTGYTVEITGDGAPGPQSTTSTSASIPGLVPGARYDVRVFATNRAQVADASDWSRSSAVRAAAVGVPGAFAVRAGATTNQVSISWTVPGAAGGSAPRFDVYRSTSATTVTGCSATGTRVAQGLASTTYSESPDRDATYVYTVVASNGIFCSSAGATAESVTPPGRAEGSVAVEYRGPGGLFKARVQGLSAPGAVDSYRYRLGSGEWRPVPADGFIADDNGNGVPLSVTLQACRTGQTRDECGPASAATSATPVDTRAVVSSCTVGAPLGASEPRNVGTPVTSVVVTFAGPGFPGGVSSDPEGIAYGYSSVVPDGATSVSVKATVDGHTDPESATALCDPAPGPASTDPTDPTP